MISVALFRHVLSGTYPGESWTTTLHTTGNVALTAAQAAWESAVNAFWTGQLDALVHSAVVATEASTAEIDEATGKQMSRLAASLSLPGVATQGPLPPQVSVVLSLRTALATRAGRGRMYLPPYDKATVSQDGDMNATSQSATVTAANQFFQSLISDGLVPVIAHRNVPVTTTNITQFDVGSVYDTQRRRRNKLIESRQGGSV